MRASSVRVSGFLVGVVMALSPSVVAAPISYGSFSGTVIDFDGLAGSSTLGAGEVLNNQYSGLGVTFNVPNFDAYATTGTLAFSALNSDPNVIWVDQGGGGGGASALGLEILFSAPQSQVGLFVGTSLDSTATLSVFNGATLLETLTVGLSPGGFGLEGFLAISNSNITRMVVSSASLELGQNWNFIIDDLKLDNPSSVPEPSTFFLLLGGLGLAIYSRDKRKSRR